MASWRVAPAAVACLEEPPASAPPATSPARALLSARLRRWLARSETGSRRSVARRSATGSPSASRAVTRCATSSRARTISPLPVRSAVVSYGTAVRPATRRSHPHSRWSARSAARPCATPSSSAHPSAVRGSELRDLREADQRDDVVLADLAVVELAQEPHHLFVAPDLRVVVLDLAR